LLKEKRSHLSQINAIGELCAQFRRGILAEIRSLGTGAAKKIVENYHELHPEAAKQCWYPDTLEEINGTEWQQLYVNAEHNGKIGIISISRESYNQDVNEELNRAIDWLKNNNIERVIVTGDFHLSTQMVGADTNEFFPALNDREIGFQISLNWSKTARRLNDEFKVSVGFINGKRCLGGFLELLMHCHFLISVNESSLGMPEVTLPVVPGMEGCHWPFRKANSRDWPKLLNLLLGGKFIKSQETVGWLTDFTGSLEESLSQAWKIVSGLDHGIPRRTLESGALKESLSDIGNLIATGDESLEAARKAIFDTIRDSCKASLPAALEIQARHSAEFMTGPACQKGVIGNEFFKTMLL
jgi:enoyl-CoA hydratase/carnithine racemase